MPPRWKNARATAKAAVIVSTVVPIPPTPVAALISPAAVAAPISPVAASISPAHATVPITPTAAPGPTAAAANILRNPQRHRQLPAQFRDNDAGEGESFHLENVSGDEGDEMVNSPSIADCMQ
ncbi:hypothetical protein F4604DRAFT_1677187 [Suillus subluteus]|nr:hypothetical protein F4604DRAFT_1677187 [Suillus subluteus]